MGKHFNIGAVVAGTDRPFDADASLGDGEDVAGGPDQAETGEPRRPRLRIDWTRKATVWLVGGLVVATATTAAALVASAPNASHPRTVAETSSKKNALNAILLKHPNVGKPVSELIQQKNLPKPTYQGDNGRVGVPASAKPPSMLTSGGVARFNPGAVNGAFNLLQLAALAMKAGCPASAAPIAAAIAAAESGGNPGAQGDIALMDSTWDWSAGLWQIRGLRAERGTGGLRDSLANADPMKNALAMVTISSGCTNWTPWSTFMSGAYLPYLGMSKTAALAAVQYHDETGSYPPMGSGPPATVPPSAPSSSRRSHKPSPSRSHKPRPSRSHQPGRRKSGGTGSAPGAGSTGGVNPVRSSAPAAPKPSLPKPSLPSLPKPSLPSLPKPSLPKPSLPTLSKPSLPKLPKPTLPTLP